jgi:hypothetical protein
MLGAAVLVLVATAVVVVVAAARKTPGSLIINLDVSVDYII